MGLEGSGGFLISSSAALQLIGGLEELSLSRERVSQLYRFGSWHPGQRQAHAQDPLQVRVRARAPVSLLEVGEHAGQYLQLGRDRQQLPAERDLRSRSRRHAEEGLACVLVHDLAPIEGVEVGPRRWVVHEEMAGHTDAFQLDPGTPAHGDHQDRQRDRYPNTALDDFVQKGVGGIVIIGGIAPKADLPKEAEDEVIDLMNPVGKAIELFEPHFRLELRFGSGGYGEGALRKIELFLGKHDHVGETLDGVHSCVCHDDTQDSGAGRPFGTGAAGPPSLL